MPIPPSDELLVKEEIKSAILEKAFVELAREFSRSSPQAFDLAAKSVIDTLRAYPVRRFVPPESAKASAFDEKRIQQEGFGLAIEACVVALDRIKKSGRART